MKGFLFFIAGIVSVLPLAAHAGTAHSSLMVTATAVVTCSVQMDHHAFNVHKKMNHQYIHTQCAGGELPYRTHSESEDGNEYDNNFEEYSESKGDDDVRWITAEF